MQKLCGGAFYGCGLEEIVLPENIIYVGTQGNRVGLFEGCENLREIVIPQNAKQLGYRCFYGCSKLEKIEIGNAVETIGDDAFLYCSSLSELTIPDSVTSFEFNSIAYTNITHFVFPKNLKPTKPFYMPKYADGVLPEYLVIQKGTLYLDYNWFYIYPTLKSFFYEGTANEYEYVTKDSTAYSSWSGVTSQEGIDEWVSRLTVYFYSETEPTEEGNYWRYVNGIPVVW